MYIVYLLLSIAAATAVPYYDNEEPSDVYLYDLEDTEYHFNEFIQKFDKHYRRDEYEYRIEIFKENLNKINDLNRKKDLKLHGITQFSDMTDEEFLNFANCYNNKGLNMTNVNVINLESLPKVTYPSELNYRDHNMVTGVKNQGTCGSCYIFAAVANIEGQYAKTSGQLRSLSEQEGLDCAAPNGCEGGYPVDVMQRLASFGGLVPEEAYPYYGQQKACSVDKNQIVVRVRSGQMLQGGEDYLITALNEYGPVVVGIHVNPSFKNWFNNGHVFNDPTCAQDPSMHAVLLIGYGTNSEGAYWLLKNSWGTRWGEGGLFRMARGVGMCGIGSSEVSTATVG